MLRVLKFCIDLSTYFVIFSTLFVVSPIFNIFKNDSNPIVKKMPCKELHTRRAATFSSPTQKWICPWERTLNPQKVNVLPVSSAEWAEMWKRRPLLSSPASPVSRLNSIAFARALWQEWSNFVHKLLIVFHLKHDFNVSRKVICWLEHGKKSMCLKVWCILIRF